MGAVDMMVRKVVGGGGEKKKPLAKWKKKKGGRGTKCALADNVHPCTYSLAHTYPSIRTKEGRPGLTVTNGDWYCSKLQVEQAHLTKVKHCSLSLYLPLSLSHSTLVWHELHFSHFPLIIISASWQLSRLMALTDIYINTMNVDGWCVSRRFKSQRTF